MNIFSLDCHVVLRTPRNDKANATQPVPAVGTTCSPALLASFLLKWAFYKFCKAKLEAQVVYAFDKTTNVQPVPAEETTCSPALLASFLLKWAFYKFCEAKLEAQVVYAFDKTTNMQPVPAVGTTCSPAPRIHSVSFQLSEN